MIVAAYSPSPQGEASLAAAMEEAASRSEDLTIASHAFMTPDGGFDCADRDAAAHAFARVASRCSDRVRRHLETLDVDIDTSHSEDIAGFILQVSERKDASLIVLALRHAAGSGHMLLGHSVRKVIVNSACPVMVAKDSESA